MFRAAPARSAVSATASSYIAMARLFLMGRLVICRVRNFPSVGTSCSHRIAIGVAFQNFAPRHSLSALAWRRERRRPFLGSADGVANRALDDDKFYHRRSFFPLQIVNRTPIMTPCRVSRDCKLNSLCAGSRADRRRDPMPIYSLDNIRTTNSSVSPRNAIFERKGGIRSR